MMRVEVAPKMLRWARERAGMRVDALAGRFPQLPAWESEKVHPTMKQLERFASVVHAPIGYLFLPEPPQESLPIPDFRTVTGAAVARPSPDLLDTIYTMQRRQVWLRETLIEGGGGSLGFVGSAGLKDEPEAIGREMRRIVGFGDGWAARIPSWKAAVGELRRALEQLGLMAVVNGVVGNNNHRKLNVNEFRGFALSDPYAPLIFINGSDAESAKMFTLAHESAHVWLGESALSDVGLASHPSQQVEEWCNQAAAEFLAPQDELKAYWREIRHEKDPFELIARRFKVSPIVAARRAFDLRLIGREAFSGFYNAYIHKERSQSPKTGGGDFYNTQNTRVGELFAGHVVRAALEGRVGFKEAYELTGLYGGAFQEYARRLGFDF
jgi:Zn-dependent peptidase ImmA (M78 family)